MEIRDGDVGNGVDLDELIKRRNHYGHFGRAQRCLTDFPHRIPPIAQREPTKQRWIEFVQTDD